MVIFVTIQGSGCLKNLGQNHVPALPLDLVNQKGKTKKKIMFYCIVEKMMSFACVCLFKQTQTCT